MTSVSRETPEIRRELRNLPENWIDTLFGELYNGSLQVTDCHRRYQGANGCIESQIPLNLWEFGSGQKERLSEKIDITGGNEVSENVEGETNTSDNEWNVSENESDTENPSLDLEKEDSDDVELDSFEMKSSDVEGITLIDLFTKSKAEWEARKTSFFKSGEVKKKSDDVQKEPEISSRITEDVEKPEDCPKEATEYIYAKIRDVRKESQIVEETPNDGEKDPENVKNETENVNNEAKEDIFLEAEGIQEKSENPELESEESEKRAGDVTMVPNSDDSLTKEVDSGTLENAENVTVIATEESDDVEGKPVDKKEIPDDSQKKTTVLELEDAKREVIDNVEEDSYDEESERIRRRSIRLEKEAGVEASGVFQSPEIRSEDKAKSETSFDEDTEIETSDEIVIYQSYFDDVKPETEHILHLRKIAKHEIQFFKSQSLVLQCQQASENALLEIKQCKYPDYEMLRKAAFITPKVEFNEGIPEIIKQKFMSLLVRISQLKSQFLIIQSQSASKMARLFLVNQQNRMGLVMTETNCDILEAFQEYHGYPTSIQELLSDLEENIAQNKLHSMILSNQWASRSTTNDFEEPVVRNTEITILRAENLLKSLGFGEFTPEIILLQVINFLEQFDRYKAQNLVIQCQNASKFARISVIQDEYLGLFTFSSVPEFTNRQVSNQSEAIDAHQLEDIVFPEEYIAESPNPDDSWLQFFNIPSPLDLSTLHVDESLLVNSLDVSVSSILSEMPDVNLSEKLIGQDIASPSGRRRVLRICQNLNALVNCTEDYFPFNEYDGPQVFSLHLPSTSRNEQPERLIRYSNPRHRYRETPKVIEEEEENL
ncbi:hypothetical protein GCK72_007017 [Caenorhabditis remanei]|uniref:Uncharacterized protein n=1 Tax=Caenorhabditis remanei TaxID=31234 RepID=A0A6A5HI34_CAERE|nr:hypothetical protein GCK72_007017 [Caenorhabditis remanei]KAF1767059.1 hypothetical protein GCK72_007017 [Caenorhabditis remanei]